MIARTFLYIHVQSQSNVQIPNVFPERKYDKINKSSKRLVLSLLNDIAHRSILYVFLKFFSFFVKRNQFDRFKNRIN